MLFNYSLSSHVGKIRNENQDNYICGKQYNKGNLIIEKNGLLNDDWNYLFGVFDGMGGEEKGSEASYIAAKYASEYAIDRKKVLESMALFCKESNRRISRFAEDNNISSMGTTAALLSFDRKNIYLCNVGDSPIFCLRNGKINKISKDHVLAKCFDGKKSPLTQFLGIPEDEIILKPYSDSFEHENKDRYLICSDGLTDMVSIKRICEILSNIDIEECANVLVKEALQNGGVDNITVICIEIKKKNIFGWR